MDSTMVQRLEPKLLYRRLDSLFGALDPELAPRLLTESFLEDAFKTLRADLRLQAGLLYGEGRDGFSLLKAVGPVEPPAADEFEAQSRPVALVLHHGVYIFADPDSDDSPFRHGIVPQRPTAAVVVGRRPKRFILFFLLAEGWVREELDFALNTVRAALGSRLREGRALGSLEQAAEIQQSLLVEEPPSFPGFDLAARSRPAEEVGGDFFDFAVFDEDMLGLSIGDASGHGLPAALLVRDVVTGLRMGLERELKIAHVFTKLNRVIHRSTLSSRFVSVFYGELERNGNLIYVNAGHQPPLVFHGKGKALELTTGGTVIGPLPEARFHRGMAYLQPGDVLVMCTDGILERRDREGTFFGEDRLRAVVRARKDQSASVILEAIFDASEIHGSGRSWEDDATVVVVRRRD
jgi:sigma-B regulation protein RsbU (phosphoserine phosphatase)